MNLAVAAHSNYLTFAAIAFCIVFAGTVMCLRVAHRAKRPVRARPNALDPTNMWARNAVDPPRYRPADEQPQATQERSDV